MQQQDTITFQLATHYLPRIALRLECLYETINQACEETHPVLHHYALKNLIEITKLIEKPELKSRFLKELMRIEHAWNKAQISISSELAEQLHSHIHTLNHVVGRFGENIYADLFLQSLRTTLPGQNNDCEIHSPQLLLWLESNPALRQRDLVLWLNNLRTLQATVSLYLSLVRDTAEFTKIDIPHGFYQRQLPPNTACHLILLRIEKSYDIVPRMQLGHRGLSLRLCEAKSMREIRETDARLDLAVCQL